MSGELVLLARARRDLGDIYAYSADRWGPVQAELYLRRLADGMRAAAVDPMGGRPIILRGRSYWRWRCASHVIFYAMAPRGIVVVRILHERMDVRRHV